MGESICRERDWYSTADTSRFARTTESKWPHHLHILRRSYGWLSHPGTLWRYEIRPQPSCARFVKGRTECNDCSRQAGNCEYGSGEGAAGR